MQASNRQSSATAAAPSGSRTIAVTGGAGFLGSHLCERLIARGDTVVCLDNFDTGRRDNVGHLIAHDRFRLIEHDILRPLPAGLPRFGQIYNLACPASPIHYQRDPVRTALVCSQGVMNMLERAEHDGADFFQASTSEVYGDPLVHPQLETYRGNVNTIGPRACYDEGKRFAEVLVTDFAHRAGLRAVIARIFNTYGPRMQFDDGRVVSNFVVQALTGEPLTIYGDGSQTRSFCFVDDLIAGFLSMMERDRSLDGPVNLGDPEELRVSELAELILEMTGSASPIIHRPLPVDDPRRRRPDIARARTLLGWEPATSLADGLKATIAEFAVRLNLGTTAQNGRPDRNASIEVYDVR